MTTFNNNAQKQATKKWVSQALGVGCDDGDAVDRAIHYVNKNIYAERIDEVLKEINAENETNFIWQHA